MNSSLLLEHSNSRPTNKHDMVEQSSKTGLKVQQAKAEDQTMRTKTLVQENRDEVPETYKVENTKYQEHRKAKQQHIQTVTHGTYKTIWQRTKENRPVKYRGILMRDWGSGVDQGTCVVKLAEGWQLTGRTEKQEQ